MAQMLCTGGDGLEDDEHTSQPRTVRSQFKIQEAAMLVRANLSQTIDEIAAAAGITHDTCHKILSDDANMCTVIHTA
jgi:predicted transcriptional regulator